MTAVGGMIDALGLVMPIHRHAALAPLSRDHHIALQLAAALREGGSRHLRSRLPPEPLALAAYVRRLFELELEPHFAAEELELMVAVDGLDRDLDTLCAELRRDHDRMRRLIMELSRTADATAIADILDRFGTLLEAHVRVEERTLFTRVQELLDAPALAKIAPRLAQHLHVHDAG